MLLDIQERNIEKEQLNKLKEHLPKQCKNCSFLEIIDLKNMKVKCFYRVTDKCILSRENKGNLEEKDVKELSILWKNT